ncbi:hypothetical protein HJC23_014065 [Cyclotella cryptica]|uniref:Uncharacterized protein n=1 Tax=Cyclotella cryptica TaxID=29204 RepID=A0ABD3QSW2_9STRA
MDYPRRQAQPPGTRQNSNAINDTDDENHSVFDFPQSFTPPGGNGDYTTSRKSRSKTPQRRKQGNKSCRSKSRDPAANSMHPYPSSISIQRTQTSSEKRSPTASPVERDALGRTRGEYRQENSPYRPKNLNVNNFDNPGSNRGGMSELEEHHHRGNTLFLRNRLSEAVDAYSHAIRSGLEELKHRKEMMSRLGSGRDVHDGHGDAILTELGESIAAVHFDMAKALEVCGKYSDACVEYNDGIGLLQNTCHKKNNDEMLKRAFQDVTRMQNAVQVEDQRAALQEDIEAAMRKVESSTTSSAKESARVSAMGCVKKLLRVERDAMGEQCYAVAKLKLKLAKLKCECGDIDDGLDDAESALKTLKFVLGNVHTLVGASCSFAASAYEKRVSIISSTPTTCSKPIEQLAADAKVMINRALELYADTLEPLQFKYNEDDTLVRPDIGDVLHKIGRLYAKKGGHTSALDAYRRSLECYGASHQGFHSDAAIVWHDIAELHLASREYQDAIQAAKKSSELAWMVKSMPKSKSCSERIETLPVWNLQIAGDAYSAANRVEDATRSYQDALVELKKIHPSNSHSARGFSLGPLEESRLLKRIGIAHLKQENVEEAKASFIDALRVMRLDRDNENSPEMPLLMADIGTLHIKTRDFTDAMTILRSCLKLYADQGTSDYAPQVQKARELFKRAQDNSTGRLDDTAIESFVPRVDRPQAQSTVANTPRTPATALTHPSTNPSSNESDISPRHLEVNVVPDFSPTTNSRQNELSRAKSQLEQANTEITRLKEAHKMETSRLKEAYGASHREQEMALSSELERARQEISRLKQELETKARQVHTVGDRKEELKTLSSQLDKAKQEISKLKEAQSRDAQLLQDAAEKSKNAQQKLKEVEAERDQERKDRINSATSHRKEMESAVSKARAELKSELEALQKELRVSESSYQQILRAIDDEKEQLVKAHDSEILKLTNENSKLRAELQEIKDSKEREKSTDILHLEEQNKKAAQENALLKIDNRNLRNEKDKLSAQVSELNEKITQTSSERLSNKHSSPDIVEKLRKMEMELQSEKSRRTILEASLDKEYESRNVTMPMAMPGGYPMFGYQPMNMQMNYGSDKNERKAKLLEVDLAAERANKDVLEQTISDLSAALEQEKDAARAHAESLMATHEREMNEVFIELKRKEDEVEELASIASQFQSVLNDLSETKELLDKKSRLADAYEHEHALLEKAREDISNEKKISATLRAQLVKEQDCLHAKRVEFDELVEKHEQMKKEYNEVARYYESEIEQLRASKHEAMEDVETKLADMDAMKAAHKQEIARLEDKIVEAKSTHDQDVTQLQVELAETLSLHRHEVARLTGEHDDFISSKMKEFAESKLRLKNALGELEDVYSSKEALEIKVQELTVLLDDRTEELAQAKARIDAVDKDAEALRKMSEKLQAELNQAKEEMQCLMREKSSLEIEMDRVQGELLDAQRELVVYSEQFTDLEQVLNQMDSRLVSADACLKEKEDALKISSKNLLAAQHEIDAKEEDVKKLREKQKEFKEVYDRILAAVIKKMESLFPEVDYSDAPLESLEEKKTHISELTNMICQHIREADASMKEKEKQIDAVNFEMSSALRELDTLESKYKQTREELAATIQARKRGQDLEHDYDELLMHYEKTCADLESAETDMKNLHEKLRDSEFERDRLLEEFKRQHAEISSLKEGIEQHLKSLKTIEEQRDLFQARLKEAVDDLEELENERNELRCDLDKTYSESAKLEKSLMNRIACLEEENERLLKLDSQSLERDAISWDKEHKFLQLEKELERAHAELEILRRNNPSQARGVEMPSSLPIEENDLYPDILPSDVDTCDELASLRSVVRALERQNIKLCEKLAELQAGSHSSPLLSDAEAQTIERSTNDAHCPSVCDAAAQTTELLPGNEDIMVLKTRLSELIDQNDELTKQIDWIKQEADSKIAKDCMERVQERNRLLEEIGSLTGKVQHLQEVNEDLSAKMSDSKAELVKAAARDGERLSSLQNEVDDLKEHNKLLKHDLNELSSRCHYAVNEGPNDEAGEKEEMLQEITSLRDHIETLEEYNEELSAQLAELQDAVVHIRSKERDAVAAEIESLQREIQTLKRSKTDRCIDVVGACGAQTNDQQKIQCLQNALDEKELDLQNRGLDDHNLRHNAELEAIKAQLNQLQECNDSKQDEISMLQMELQNALDACDDNEIRHQQELSTVNMEFTNALNSLQGLQKENQRLKQEIQTLSSMAPRGMSPDDSAYFEKDLSAAHSRFVSMERSLQDRIERLEKEKYNLIAAHNDEMQKKDIAFERVRVELSAWKLEMQNALNDIEGLKRERNELEQQVVIYKATLDAIGSSEEEADVSV